MIYSGEDKGFDPRGARLGDGGNYPSFEVFLGDHGAYYAHQKPIPSIVAVDWVDIVRLYTW